MTRLRGRRTEWAALERLLEAGRAGRGGAVVFEGAPGIGKTALLERLREAATDFRILHAIGVEPERDLAFAALHRLTTPLLGAIGELPEPQRAALRAAFGLSDADAPDPTPVGLAALGLMTRAATARPVLCVVDDAQWLDQASAQAMALVADHARREPIVMVLAARDGGGRDGGRDGGRGGGGEELAALPRSRLDGLPDGDARALLLSRIHAPLDERVRDRIVAEARGNPLALLDVARSGGPADLAGGFAFGGSRIPAEIEERYREPLAALPARTRLLLLVAAADPTGDPELLERATTRLGTGPDDLSPARRAGLFEVGTRARFDHPLLRSVLYRAAPPPDRRAAHRVLAEVSPDAVRRAWHRGKATVGPDTDVADDLENSAGRARARGGAAAAAAFLELATALTPDPSRRADRALAAARAKRDAGAAEESLELLAVAAAGPADTLRDARVETLRARIAFETRRDDAAYARLLTAARLTAPLDVRLARETLLEAFAAAAFAGRFGPPHRLLEVAAAARALHPSDRLLNAHTTRVIDGYLPAVPLLRPAVRDGQAEQDTVHGIARTLLAGDAAMDLWDHEAGKALADRQVEAARSTGAVTALPMALNLQAVAHVHAGELPEAAARLAEASAVADAIGAPAIVHGELALAAWRGDEQGASALIGSALREGTARGEGRLVTLAEHARTVLLNGLGRYEAALEACRTAHDLDEPGFLPWVVPEFLEAATRAGRRDLAVPALTRFRERVHAVDTDWAVGTGLRARAMLTDDSSAEKLFVEAVERLTAAGLPGHLARARLAYGEWLRREGRRRDSRTELRSAFDALSAMGAEAFAARAARELRATGEQVQGRGAGETGRLTAQELNVARLVTAGATSREVGAQLFLSPRTIDAHLRSIYRKLGITSRRQLRELRL
ncbi:helix-turn-helix transcriptional regulator [Actinomadura harenae]|uniref:Helix-turn-helix transcriptional regulator n=1 Tax=Actinomadura harenae TaxID=2483351 RepID=A0A3M2MAF8_9ACTN|nr:LuxR family transcriptional regulator [Actinomadura harenae]RMI44108.1 helix-turn-helix transcriptional regulator [Actinomadura harenae]